MSDAYAAEITKHAVARASVSFGYTKCSVTALDALADVIQNYVETYGNLIKEQSETGGRTHPGLYDAMSALNTINEKQQSWVELCNFAFPSGKDKSNGWCQPFPAVIPPFPLPPSKKLFTNPSEAPEDYPNHLPPYPPAHTYMKGEPKKRKAESSKSNRAKKIAAAKSIQNSLTSNNYTTSSKNEPLVDSTSVPISDADLRTADPIDRISQSSSVISQMTRNDRVILGLEEEEEEV